MSSREIIVYSMWGILALMIGGLAWWLFWQASEGVMFAAIVLTAVGVIACVGAGAWISQRAALSLFAMNAHENSQLLNDQFAGMAQAMKAANEQNRMIQTQMKTLMLQAQNQQPNSDNGGLQIFEGAFSELEDIDA